MQIGQCLDVLYSIGSHIHQINKFWFDGFVCSLHNYSSCYGLEWWKSLPLIILSQRRAQFTPFFILSANMFSNLFSIIAKSRHVGLNIWILKIYVNEKTICWTFLLALNATRMSSIYQHVKVVKLPHPWKFELFIKRSIGKWILKHRQQTHITIIIIFIIFSSH